MYQIYFVISGFSLLLAVLVKLKKSKRYEKRRFRFFIFGKNKKPSSFKRRALMVNFRNKLVLFFSKFGKNERYYELRGEKEEKSFRYSFSKNKKNRGKFDHLFEHKTEIDEEKKKEFLKKIEEYKRMEQEEKKKNKIIKPWGFGSVLPDRYENKQESSLNNAVWNNASHEEKKESVGFFGRFGGGKDNDLGQQNNVNSQGFNNNVVFGNNNVETREVNRNNVFSGFDNSKKVEDEKINIFNNTQNSEKKDQSFGSLVGKDNSKEDEDDKPMDFFKMFSK